jgi:transposase
MRHNGCGTPVHAELCCVEGHHVEVSGSTVRRYIATTFTEQRTEERVTVPRGAVEAGSEAQIDYGKLGMWWDPVSGRRVAVWVFAMILSCSRAMFVQPVLKMDQTSWNASHVAAFEFFGGVPARLVCDNLKPGVERADLYDPLINLAYGELAAFYGTLIDPARAQGQGLGFIVHLLGRVGCELVF